MCKEKHISSVIRSMASSYHPFVNPIVNPADILAVKEIPKQVIVRDPVPWSLEYCQLTECMFLYLQMLLMSLRYPFKLIPVYIDYLMIL